MEQEDKPEEEKPIERTTEGLIDAFAAMLRHGCQNNDHLGVCYVVGFMGPMDPETSEQAFMFQSNANTLPVINRIMARMLDEAAAMDEDPLIIDPNQTQH